MTLSAVIPTRNRPEDLARAVESILAQTRPPDELIIVDQSPGDESERLVRGLFQSVAPSHPEPGTQNASGVAPRLVYIHDPGVPGLVAAKRVGSTRAASGIVCFLEDDVVLEAEYMARIESGFEDRPEMCGCSGIITNWPGASALHIAVRALFFRGIFHDPRLEAFAEAMRGSQALIPCDVLSGGLSAWRRHVFTDVPFDTDNGFFMFEDMEFSTRVVRALGHCLYINPAARLEHLWSPVNRDVQGTRQRRKLAEALTFFKKRRHWPGAWFGLAMVMVWWLVEALRQTVGIRSTGPVRGYVRGVIDGIRRPLVRQAR